MTDYRPAKNDLIRLQLIQNVAARVLNGTETLISFSSLAPCCNQVQPNLKDPHTTFN